MWFMDHIVRDKYFNNLSKAKGFRDRLQIERTIVSNNVHPFSSATSNYRLVARIGA